MGTRSPIVSNTENNIDALLIFMNDTLEVSGRTAKNYRFAFDPGKPDHSAALNSTSLSPDELISAIKVCLSRRLIEQRTIGGGLSSISLTDEGQGRAISTKLGKDRSYELGAAMHIANLTVNGPAQVGNYNSQEFNNCFQTLIQKIEASNTSPAEKEEAKNLLKKALEHPLTSAIVGGITGAVAGVVIK